MSAQKGKSPQQKNEDENTMTDKPEWEAEKTAESINERHLTGSDASVSLEELFPLFSSQLGSCGASHWEMLLLFRKYQ